MKFLISLALMALIKADDTTVTHATTLKCGQCIKGGYNFCYLGTTDGPVITNGGSEPTSTCCADTSCSQNSDATYMCSSQYSDKEYALQMCPQKQAVCGTNQTMEFTQTGQEQNVTISGMTTGDSCSYKIKSKKGSPAFKMSNSSTAGDSKVNITFVEFEMAKVNYTNATGRGGDKSPDSGMAAKNQSFENSGNQGTKGGQKKPSRKTSNGTMTKDESMDSEKEYMQKKKKNEEDAAKEEEEDEGWFRPNKNKDDSTTTTDTKPKKASGEGFNET